MTGIDGKTALLKMAWTDLSVKRKTITDKQLSERLEYEQAIAGRQFATLYA